MKIPIVVIVGRPNVGKSTLFNRILRRRAAIVDDRPGVTRDRHYARAEWRGRSFFLVDTGGLVPQSRDRMEISIKKQVEAAILESDLLLMVVDAKDGLLGTDQHIADLLRRSRKPLVLAVNKVDSARDEDAVQQFHRLGLGEPYMVSAASGRSSGDLLVNAITGQERVIVDSEPGTTRDAVDTVFHWQGNRLILLDTAGLRRKPRVGDELEFYTRLRTERAIEQSDVGVLVLDAQEEPGHLDLSLAGMLDQADRAVVLAVNKWDLSREKNQARYLGWLRERMAFLPYVRPVFTSALKGFGVSHLLQEIESSYRQWRKQHDPELLKAAFEETVQQYHPPSPGGKEVMLLAIRQMGICPPTFEVLTNQPKLVAESYRRYLINGLRERLGIRGTPLRISFKLSRPPQDWQHKRYLDYGQRPKFKAENTDF